MGQTDAAIAAPWYELLSARTAELSTALAAARILVGACHRLAWSGPDDGGDRAFALAGLQRATAALAEHRPALSALIDWWMVAALGEGAVSEAWSIDRLVPGCGEALREVLSGGGDRPLTSVRRPYLLARTLVELEAITSTHAGKIAPAIRILKEANAECLAVVRAGREGRAAPTVRLAGLSESALISWASESQAGRHVEPGTPVWEHTTRSLRDRADLVDRALAAWPRGPELDVRLPPNWRQEIVAACESEAEAEIPLALVADLLEEAGPRPVLEPAVRALAVAPERDARSRVLAIAREAFAAAGSPLPAWARETLAAVEEVQEEIDQLTGAATGDGAASLAEARAALGQRDLKMAREWLSAAREELSSARADATVTRKRSAARALVAELSAIGVSVPEEVADVQAWASLVEERFAAAKLALQRRLDEVIERGPVFGRRAPKEDPDVPAARAGLQRQSLRAASEALARAEARLAAARDADDAFLGRDLVSLRDRALRLPERVAFLEALDRAAHRREAGLDAAPLIQDLMRLLALLEQRAKIATVIDLESRRSVAYALAGMATSAPVDGQWAQVHGRAVLGDQPSDALRRVLEWGEVVEEPISRAQSRQQVFVERDGDVIGPYVTEGGVRPRHRWQAVGFLPVARFEQLFGRVDVGAGRWLVPYPPSLEELVQAGAEIVDDLDDDVLAGWLAREIEGCPPAEALAAWLRARKEEGLPPQVRDARFERLAEILGSAKRLARLKDRAVAEWLASAEGREALRAAALTAVAEAETEIRAGVERRRQELEAALAPLEAARHEAVERLEAVRAEISDVEAALEDRQLALVARLLSGSLPQATASPSPPKVALVTAPIRAARFAPYAMPPMAELVEQVAGDTWDPAEVANLLLSVSTGRWTLLAGLPGVGKSTFVRSVLARIGHGAGTGRYLEMVVRRDWQDDTPLFGFWHPTHHAWEPSSEGFVEHILRARDDAASGYGGFYPVLVEELNLASPEYYLARPISALEAADPTVRLYDPELVPANRDRYPSTFSIPDSVRLLGTVNVDDTVERLSPRFLSRASVIWVEPRPDAPLWKPEDDVPQAVFRWSDLRAAVDRREEDLGAIDPVLRFLVERRVPGAPTARTRAAISRFLGASRGLLPRQHAEDLQILQRVLPPLRGVGPRWRKLLDELEALLRRQGWARSADRTLDLRQRGEELGDWYDFFHT